MVLVYEILPSINSIWSLFTYKDGPLSFVDSEKGERAPYPCGYYSKWLMPYQSGVMHFRECRILCEIDSHMPNLGI